QNIFNGGAVGLQKEMQKAISRQKANTTEVSLYKMRRQLNQVYYGILLSRENLKVNQLLIDNLKSRLKTVRSQVENGVLLQSQQFILEAESLKAKQNRSDITANIKAGYLVLSELTGKQFRSDTKLALPEASQIIRPDSLPKLRPRYKLSKSQINV